MPNFNVKQKMNTAFQHVKTHPTVYAVGLALTVSAVTQYVYFTKKGMASINDIAKDMAETGKGVYFHNTKTGVTIIAALYDPETMKNLKFLD